MDHCFIGVDSLNPSGQTGGDIDPGCPSPTLKSPHAILAKRINRRLKGLTTGRISLFSTLDATAGGACSGGSERDTGSGADDWKDGHQVTKKASSDLSGGRGSEALETSVML